MRILVLLFPLILSGCANLTFSVPYCVSNQSDPRYRQDINKPVVCMDRVGIGIRVEF